MKADHDRIEALVTQALEFKPEERAAFLSGACGEDHELRRKVETLLDAAGDAQGFMEGATAPGATPHFEGPGTIIGRYKLLQMIGEGGMGVVYLAEQTEPVTRRVALKIIKLGMDTKQVIARFEAERQALALMDHPNIAQVLDAGTTGGMEKAEGRSQKEEVTKGGSAGALHPSSFSLHTSHWGRPYFVMELVRGIPITRYCDENKLDTKRRLNLFIKVCQAIQHAHQKGIIHRDIKPSNILVTLHDGVPVPKVIDFGIAKATEGRLTDRTLFTAFEQFIGTPAYMSPEQAEMSGLDIDTRSDIYALGVLLYELLTGKTPFDAKELAQAGLDAMRRTIREVEPPRPSTRLSTLQGDARTTTALAHGTDAHKLFNLIRGDLDWIVMKCLEKDRTRRYETANGLAADLKRHLENEPVVARPPSAAYKFQKAWRRNKVVYTAAATVFAALVIGITTSLWQAANAIRARRQAEQAEAAREMEARTASRERDIARAATARAERERIRAEGVAETNRLNLYAADMRAAQLAADGMNFGVARELLGRHRPRANQRDLRDFAWRLLWQQCKGDQLHTIAVPARGVRCVTFDPTGRYVLAGSGDGNAVVSEAASGTVVRSWKAHEGVVHSVSISPDGHRLATSGSDGAIKLWEWPEAVLVATLPIAGGYAKFDRTQGWLYIGSGHNFQEAHSDGVKLWKPGAGSTPEVVVDLGTNRTAFPTPNRDGSLVAIASRHENVVLTDFEGKVLRRLEESAGAIGLAFSPDSAFLAVCSGVFGKRPENEIRIHEVDTGGLVIRLTNHTSRVTCLDFSPDGRRLATSGLDQTIRVWDVATWREVDRLRGPGSGVCAVEFSSNGKLLATGGEDVRIWEVDEARDADHIGGVEVRYGKNIEGVFLDGERLFAGRTSNHRGVGIWSVSTGELLRELESESVCLGENQDQTAMITMSPGKPFVLRFWGMREFNLLHELAISRDLGSIYLPRLSSDRRSLIFGGSGKAIEIDCATGRLQETELLPGREIHYVELSPDRQMWAAITGPIVADGKSVAFLSATPGSVSIIRGHGHDIFDIEFSPTEQVMATASIDSTARLWELPSGRQLAVLAGHREGVFDCDYSPDGKTLATASGDKTVKLWHVATRREMVSLQHDQPVVVCRFSPEGNYLATGTIDNQYHFWRASSWEEIATAEAEERTSIEKDKTESHER